MLRNTALKQLVLLTSFALLLFVGSYCLDLILTPLASLQPISPVCFLLGLGATC